MKSKTQVAKKLAWLPMSFSPGGVESLVRLGQMLDGGYVVDRQSVLQADYLLACGINDELSFERDFLKDNAVECLGIDASISRKKFTHRIFHCFSAHPWEVFYHIHVLVKYLNFFKGQKRHLELFVGSEKRSEFVTLRDLFNNEIAIVKRSIFIKMDIEGSEYGLLEELIAFQDRIIGIVIEFHNVHENLAKIESFIAKFSLSICNVHANNCSDVDAYGFPQVIEISFSRFASNAKLAAIAAHMNLPNDPKRPDIEIEFR